MTNRPYITHCGLLGIDHVPFGMQAFHFYSNRDQIVAVLVPYAVEERARRGLQRPSHHGECKLPHAGRLGDVHAVRTGGDRALQRPEHRRALQLRAGAVQRSADERAYGQVVAVPQFFGSFESQVVT
jgi:hypothetical protein